MAKEVNNEATGEINNEVANEANNETDNENKATNERGEGFNLVQT